MKFPTLLFPAALVMIGSVVSIPVAIATLAQPTLSPAEAFQPMQIPSQKQNAQRDRERQQELRRRERERQQEADRQERDRDRHDQQNHDAGDWWRDRDDERHDRYPWWEDDQHWDDNHRGDRWDDRHRDGRGQENQHRDDRYEEDEDWEDRHGDDRYEEDEDWEEHEWERDRQRDDGWRQRNPREVERRNDDWRNDARQEWQRRQDLLRWQGDGEINSYASPLEDQARVELMSLTDDWVTVSIESIDGEQELSFTGANARQTVYLNPGAYRIRFRPTLSNRSWQVGYLNVEQPNGQPNGQPNVIRIMFDQDQNLVHVYDNPTAWTPNGYLPREVEWQR